MTELPDYLTRLLQLVKDEELSPREAAQIMDAGEGYVRQLLTGAKSTQRLAPHRRRRVLDYLATRSAKPATRAELAVRTHANGYTVTLGDAALVAVGRFEAIQQMATELARIADHSARELSAATVAEEVSLVSVAGQEALRQRRGGESHPARNTRPRRSG